MHIRPPRWHRNSEAFGVTIATPLDPETKLIVDQSQTWSISGARALAETFTPT